ncbi:hypothetical protein CRENBAI_008665 [Crenichthys baileyi]|uniref:Uncharacterized protein n=1 Tax=Crenichthys baileyi TaxID=28760 RepID=A0AAV9SEX7_9TELE
MFGKVSIKEKSLTCNVKEVLKKELIELNPSWFYMSLLLVLLLNCRARKNTCWSIFRCNDKIDTPLPKREQRHGDEAILCIECGETFYHASLQSTNVCKNGSPRLLV